MARVASETYHGPMTLLMLSCFRKERCAGLQQVRDFGLTGRGLVAVGILHVWRNCFAIKVLYIMWRLWP